MPDFQKVAHLGLCCRDTEGTGAELRCGVQKFFHDVYVAEQLDKIGVDDPYCK